MHAGGRRSSTPSTSRCASTPGCSTSPRSASSTCRRRARSTRCRAPCSRRSTSPVGRVIYTPVLGPGGGFQSDLTIMRLGDEDVPRRHRRRPRHGRPQALRRPAARGRLRDARRRDRPPGRRSGSGGRARETSWRGLTRDDVSHEGFPFASCRTLEIGSQLVLASRISYVGDLGWELYVPIEQGARLWDVLWEAGSRTALTACGIGVYGTTGRLEKCYRAYGAELESEYTVVEAGMQRPKVKDAGLRRQGRAPAPPRGGAGGDPVHAHRRRPHARHRV